MDCSCHSLIEIGFCWRSKDFLINPNFLDYCPQEEKIVTVSLKAKIVKLEFYVLGICLQAIKVNAEKHI